MKLIRILISKLKYQIISKYFRLHIMKQNCLIFAVIYYHVVIAYNLPSYIHFTVFNIQNLFIKFNKFETTKSNMFTEKSI